MYFFLWLRLVVVCIFGIFIYYYYQYSDQNWVYGRVQLLDKQIVCFYCSNCGYVNLKYTLAVAYLWGWVQVVLPSLSSRSKLQLFFIKFWKKIKQTFVSIIKNHQLLLYDRILVHRDVQLCGYCVYSQFVVNYYLYLKIFDIFSSTPVYFCI